MRTAIIDIGGGMRDAFGAGILDYFLDEKINVPLCIGVSAGASNLVTYIAGQRGRIINYYDNYPNRWQYMGWKTFLLHGSFLNMKYIYEDLSFPGKENPLDYDAYEKSEKDMILVATNALTGNAEYFSKETVSRTNVKTLEASGTIPVLCKPTMIDNIPYFDGGLSDPIPYKKAFENGAEKIIVIITKRRDDFRDPEKDRTAARILSWKYPESGKTLLKRAETYNRELKEILELESEGKVLLLAPDDTFGVTTTKHRREDVRKLYDHGYQKAQSVKEFLS